MKTSDISALDENVEKNSATAVSSASSPAINAIASSSAGSSAGASHDFLTCSGDIQPIQASTA